MRNNINYKTFWTSINDVLRPDSSNDWKKKYFAETIQYLDSSKDIIEVGCGSADFIISNKHLFNNIIGIEFSDLMVKHAQKLIDEKKIDNITIYKADATEINKHIKEKVDVVYSRGLIQYLSNNQFRLFLKNSIPLIKETGYIMHMDIPNKIMRTFYLLNMHKTEHTFSAFKFFIKFIRMRLFMFRKAGFKHFDDSIGYWYSFKEIKEIAKENELKVEFFYSKLPPFSYRFHARFTKSNS